jgi:gamma-glutamyltranspeptidase/glutathione hydrolase
VLFRSILAAVDFGLGAQECADAGRFHHQWLPDRIVIERGMFSNATLEALANMGHKLYEVGSQGRAELILRDGNKWAGGADVLRWADSAAVWE